MANKYSLHAKQVEPALNVLDLFCGCGGLSLGFEKAGYNVLLGIDVWEDALTTYKYYVQIYPLYHLKK